jgi:DNA-binding response OmpR family regulator
MHFIEMYPRKIKMKGENELNGQEAWNYLDLPQIHYTLAILDWMLPGLSGIALCQRLRAI